MYVDILYVFNVCVQKILLSLTIIEHIIRVTALLSRCDLALVLIRDLDTRVIVTSRLLIVFKNQRVVNANIYAQSSLK